MQNNKKGGIIKTSKIVGLEVTMQLEYIKLYSKIKRTYKAIYKFAKPLGISSTALYSKLNGMTPWKQAEIEKCCELLGIEKSEIGEYFFGQKVQ